VAPGCPHVAAPRRTRPDREVANRREALRQLRAVLDQARGRVLAALQPVHEHRPAARREARGRQARAALASRQSAQPPGAQMI